MSRLTNTWQAICSRLKEPKASATSRNSVFTVRLPPDSFLETVHAEDSHLLQQQCTYSLSSVSQTLRHASGILSIMSLPFIRPTPGFDIMSPFQECISSILDAHLYLHEAQRQWQYASPSPLPFLLQNDLRFLEAFQTLKNIDPLVQEKAYIVLVILCTEMSNHPTPNFTEDKSGSDAQLLCKTLVKVADACLYYKPVSRLVASHLRPALENQLAHDDDAAVVKDDLWVSIQYAKLIVATNSDIEMLRTT